MTSSYATDWSVRPLGDLARVYSGGTPLRSVPAYWNGSVPWVTTTEIDFGVIRSTRQTISDAGLESSAAKVARPGTVLIAMYGQGKTRGKSAILGIPAAMNQACAAVEVRSDLSAKYLLHYLAAHYEAIRALSNSGGQENLSGEIVKKIPVSFPSREEQDCIAAVLDDADSLTVRLEQLVAKKQAIRQGVMQQLLTGKTRLAGFTGPWRDVLLGDHVSYVRTVALSRAQLDDRSPVRYLHYGDIHTRSNAKLNAANELMPRANSALLGNAGRLQVGDVVFADASEDPDGVGKSVEITGVPSAGVVPGLHTIAARFDQNVLANGFKAYLQFIPAFRQALLRLAAGTKVLATTRSFVSSVAISLPEVDEQRAIAVVLDDVDAEIAQLEAKLFKARQVKLGMTQELLTGRTRLQDLESVK